MQWMRFFSPSVFPDPSCPDCFSEKKILWRCKMMHFMSFYILLEQLRTTSSAFFLRKGMGEISCSHKWKSTIFLCETWERSWQEAIFKLTRWKILKVCRSEWMHVRARRQWEWPEAHGGGGRGRGGGRDRSFYSRETSPACRQGWGACAGVNWWCQMHPSVLQTEICSNKVSKFQWRQRRNHYICGGSDNMHNITY